MIIIGFHKYGWLSTLKIVLTIFIVPLFPSVICAEKIRAHTDRHLKALTDYGYEISVEGLSAALEAKYSMHKYHAIKVIYQKDMKGLREKLRKLLNSSDESNLSELVRVKCASVLAMWGDEDGVAALKAEVLDGKNTGQRLLAAGTLADLGHTDGFAFARKTFLEGKRLSGSSTLQKFFNLSTTRQKAISTFLERIERPDIDAGTRSGRVYLIRIATSLLGAKLSEEEQERVIRALEKGRNSDNMFLRDKYKYVLWKIRSLSTRGERHKLRKSVTTQEKSEQKK